MTLKNLRTDIASGVAVLAMGCMLMVGCTPQQQATTVQIMQQVNTYTPAVVSAADTVAAVLTSYPAVAAVVAPVDVAFDVLAKTVQTLAASYVANPSATVLQQLQAAVNTLEASINASTLAAVKITDPASQQLALVALKGLLTVVTVVFGLVSQTETKAQLTSFRLMESGRLVDLRPYVDAAKLQEAAAKYGLDVDAMYRQADALGL